MTESEQNVLLPMLDVPPCAEQSLGTGRRKRGGLLGGQGVCGCDGGEKRETGAPRLVHSWEGSEG